MLSVFQATGIQPEVVRTDLWWRGIRDQATPALRWRVHLYGLAHINVGISALLITDLFKQAHCFI